MTKTNITQKSCEILHQELEDGLNAERLTQLPTIHFHKQLVEGVLLLVLVAKVPSAPLPADCVDLVDEKDAGGIFSSRVKRIPYLDKRQIKEKSLK